MTKNNKGEILPAQKEELGQLVRAGDRLAILQSQARLFLKREGHAGAPRGMTDDLASRVRDDRS